MGARYVTWIDGEEATVELVEAGEGVVVARIEAADGAARELRFDRARAPQGGEHLLLPDGRSVVARLTEGARGGRSVHVGPYRLGVRAVSERDAWLGAGAAGADEGRVTVSMPGLVVKLLVAEGDAVEAGQPVIIIEAMKMENEVKAGRAGVVQTVHVAAGASVEADVVLMEIGDA